MKLHFYYNKHNTFYRYGGCYYMFLTTHSTHLIETVDAISLLLQHTLHTKYNLLMCNKCVDAPAHLLQHSLQIL